MPHDGTADAPTFRAVVDGLLRGDFSALAPVLADTPERPSPIRAWCESGAFDAEPAALAEALSAACFDGCTSLAAYLLARGVDPAAGRATGLDALHWAANRGQLAAVRLLLAHGAPLETRSMYDGTPLGTAVWSSRHEPRDDHPAIVDALLAAGARATEAAHPIGVPEVDARIARARAASPGPSA